MDLKFLRSILLLLGSSVVLQAATVRNIRLDQPSFDSHDMASIKRGARHFKERCASCHSLSQAIYDPVVLASGMNAGNMPHHDVTSWLGHPPPDLSLISRTRGDAWVFTYLQTFYKDSVRQTGYNNLLLPNSNMPPVFGDLQGTYVLSKAPQDFLGIPHQPNWYGYLKQVSKGDMAPHEFRLYLSDLANFLNYIAEPSRAERESLGWKVILFLFVFWGISYALYRCYWDKIKRSKSS